VRRAGAGKRRDANEKAIVAALRAVGAEVWHLSGSGLPDILVRYRGALHAAEVKTRTGKLTPLQGDFPVWRSPDEAIRAIEAMR
jgi:hypothetical protein